MIQRMSGGGGDETVIDLHSTAHILFLDEIPSALLTYLSEPSCTSTETRVCLQFASAVPGPSKRFFILACHSSTTPSSRSAQAELPFRYSSNQVVSTTLTITSFKLSVSSSCTTPKTSSSSPGALIPAFAAVLPTWKWPLLAPKSAGHVSR